VGKIGPVAEVRCADGSVLVVRPVPVSGRDGTPYEVTLDLLRDGAPFGEVGERCGYFLAAVAARLRAAQPDFPASSLEAGVRTWALDDGRDPDGAWATLQRYLPRDRELFCFRSRDPDDLGSSGELRVTLEEERTWLPANDGAAGQWRIDCCAVLRAWGSGGTGVRAILTAAELLAFLEALLGEVSAVGASYDAEDDGSALHRPGG
jgi:hypothetical protein